MLWQIEDTPHRVLGSIHALPKNQSFPVWVQDAYANAKRMVFEADHTDKSLLEVGIDRTGEHLQWPGAQEIYDRARQLMHAIGNQTPFDGLRPWRAGLFVASALLAATTDVTPASGVEVVLRSYAEQHGLAVGFLEPPGCAFEIFESCDEPYSCLRLFECLVTDPTFAPREYSRILHAWLSADVYAMDAVLRDRLTMFPKVFGPLTLQRNREWLPVARRFIADGTPTVFIVGSLHTAGAGSFIGQLESAGMRLTRTSSNET